MCTYFVLNKYYYIIILYGGSHASDILHVLMGVSVAKLIIYTLYYYLFAIINVLLLLLLLLLPIARGHKWYCSTSSRRYTDFARAAVTLFRALSFFRALCGPD